MRRTLGVLAWGVLGAVVAVALISGAFVVAGSSLTQPASAVRVATSTPLRANTPDRHEHDPNATDDAQASPVQTTSAPTWVAPTPAVEPSSSVTTVIRTSSVPPPTQSKDGGAEHHDD